jgi:hypothetical protein
LVQSCPPLAVTPPARSRIFQDVLVEPRTTYRASAWVWGVDVRGKGFSVNPADSAGLCIEEFDADDKVLIQHPKVAASKPSDFAELTRTFTTTEKTVKVRFTLDTVIGCLWDEGHVTYDDCELIREETGRREPVVQRD